MAFNYEMMGYIALQMEHSKNKVISIKDIDSIIHYYEKYKREVEPNKIEFRQDIDWSKFTELTSRTHPNT